MNRLNEIEARTNAATEGPWELLGDGEYVSGPGILVAPDDGGVTSADAEFIAAARTDVPWLLDQVESRDKALDAALRLADQMEAEDAAMHDFYGWPRTTTGRTDTPSERIRAAITTDLEGETP